MPPTSAAPLSRQTKALALRVFLAGRRAARAGQPVTACPYHPNAAADPDDGEYGANVATVERFLADTWIKGWSRTNAKATTRH